MRDVFISGLFPHDMERQPGKSVSTTVRTFEIIQYLQEEGPAQLSQIAADLGMSKSTVHRHLNTLHDLRYVSRQEDKYQLGLRFTRLGHAARTRDKSFRKAQEHVRELAAETGERAQFVVEDHGLGVYLYMETGNQAIETGMGPGRQIHLHCSSSGKAILANSSREYVDNIIERWGLPKMTEHTITDRERLYKGLEQVRERGVAFNRQEYVEGLTAASVPVKDNLGEVVGTLSVSAPASRMENERIEETIPNLLLGSANALELELTYSREEDAETFVVE